MEEEIRIWLDDVRPMPLSPNMFDQNKWFNIHCKTAEEAIELIKTGKVTCISFDHDLGRDLTGYDVAKYIEEAAFNSEIPEIDYYIHSGNPVGAGNIDAAMKKALIYWREK